MITLAILPKFIYCYAPFAIHLTYWFSSPVWLFWCWCCVWTDWGEKKKLIDKNKTQTNSTSNTMNTWTVEISVHFTFNNYLRCIWWLLDLVERWKRNRDVPLWFTILYFMFCLMFEQWTLSTRSMPYIRGERWHIYWIIACRFIINWSTFQVNLKWLHAIGYSFIYFLLFSFYSFL